MKILAEALVYIGYMAGNTKDLDGAKEITGREQRNNLRKPIGEMLEEK